MSIAKVGNTMVAVGKFSTVTARRRWGNPQPDDIFAFNAKTGASSIVRAHGERASQGARRRGRELGLHRGALHHGQWPDPQQGRAAQRGQRLNVGLHPTGDRRRGHRHDAAAAARSTSVAPSRGRAPAVPAATDRCVAALDPSSGANTGQLTGELHRRVQRWQHYDQGDRRRRRRSRLAVVGNFRTVNGQQRTQMRSSTPAPAATLAPWTTNLFDDPCATVFDTYMRDVSISPDSKSA